MLNSILEDTFNHGRGVIIDGDNINQYSFKNQK